MPARYVIHAVGPVWGSGDEEERLAGAVRSALMLAAERDIRSISLAAISSGIFGFPKVLCAQVMIGTVTDYLAGNPAGVVREVNLCNIDEHTVNIFLDEARRQLKT